MRQNSNEKRKKGIFNKWELCNAADTDVIELVPKSLGCNSNKFDATDRKQNK